MKWLAFGTEQARSQNLLISTMVTGKEKLEKNKGGCSEVSEFRDCGGGEDWVLPVIEVFAWLHFKTK